MNKQTWGNLPIEFRPYGEFDEDCKFTLASCKEWIKYGYISNYDGHGYYATDTEISNIYIDFDDIMNNDLEDWVTHICWYNK